jgi:hypothetical protein
MGHKKKITNPKDKLGYKFFKKKPEDNFFSKNSKPNRAHTTKQNKERKIKTKLENEKYILIVFTKLLLVNLLKLMF